jgi:hypothetical protein
VKVIQVLAALGFVILGGAIVVALVTGDFSAEGGVITGLPWGVVSIIDVYTGAMLVAAWIWWRDGARAGILWIGLLIVLGHAATALYVFLRSRASRSVPELLTGR